MFEFLLNMRITMKIISKGTLPEGCLVEAVALVSGGDQEALLVPAPVSVHSVGVEVHHGQANLQ